MTSNRFDRRLENAYIVSNIEVREADFIIRLDSTWISIFSSNKKVGIRIIATKIDCEAGHSFRIKIDEKVYTTNMTYYSSIDVNVNLTTQKISDWGKLIVEVIKSLEFVSIDIQVSFDYENIYGYLFISGIVSADTSFTFSLANEWTIDYFSFSMAGHWILITTQLSFIPLMMIQITVMYHYLSLIYHMFICAGI
jgi:hypothetical protein